MKILIYSKILFLVTFLCMGYYNGLAQDPIFSQFYANPLYLNPALAGGAGDIRGTIIYRNEWPGLKAYTTYGASYDQPVDLLHGGIGVSVINDVIGGGTFNNLLVTGIYNYEVNINKESFLWMALAASGGQRGFKGKDLVFLGQVDPGQNGETIYSENINSISKWYLDFSLGTFFIYRDYYGGLALHHLSRPNIGGELGDDIRLDRKYTLHAGRHIATNKSMFGRERLNISPNILLQVQGYTQQFNYGIYLEQFPLILGGWLRQDYSMSINSFVLSIGYLNEFFQIGYSYDLFLGSRFLNIYKSTAHELTFSLKIKYESERKTKGAIKCPKF